MDNALNAMLGELRAYQNACSQGVRVCLMYVCMYVSAFVHMNVCVLDTRKLCWVKSTVHVCVQ
jgi:hypothetical protein